MSDELGASEQQSIDVRAGFLTSLTARETRFVVKD